MSVFSFPVVVISVFSICRWTIVKFFSLLKAKFIKYKHRFLNARELGSDISNNNKEDGTDFRRQRNI